MSGSVALGLPGLARRPIFFGGGVMGKRKPRLILVQLDGGNPMRMTAEEMVEFGRSLIANDVAYAEFEADRRRAAALKKEVRNG